MRRAGAGLAATGLLLLTAACGGADGIGSAAPTARLATVQAGAPTTLVVRARATLQAGVGAAMEVRLNGDLLAPAGLVVSNTGVWQDYSFAAPLGITDGDRIDVVFTNDAVTIGADGAYLEDRNLIVDSITVPGRDRLPAEAATLDTGSGSAAFDGVGTLPGQSGLWWDAALRFVVPSVPVVRASVELRASGTRVGGIGPQVQIRVDGRLLQPAAVEVRALASGPAEILVFTSDAPISSQARIDVVFTNDAVAAAAGGGPLEDRNLIVEAIRVDGGPWLAPASGAAASVIYDRGEGAAAFDGQDLVPAQAGLWWSGALRYSLLGDGAGSGLAVWATSSLDKVWRHERRAHERGLAALANPLWSSGTLVLRGAREEIVAANLIVETEAALPAVTVSIGALSGASGAVIRNTGLRQGSAVFSNQGTPLQVLAARYVPITGINRENFSYAAYIDERQIPPMLRLPPDKIQPQGVAIADHSIRVLPVDGASWRDRPGADRLVPDALIPMELGAVDIPARSSQLFALDVLLSPSVLGFNPSPGTYRGLIDIRSRGELVSTLPLEVTLVDTTLAFAPEHGLQLVTGFGDTADRLTGEPFPEPGSPAWSRARLAQDRADQLLHAYRMAPVELLAGGSEPLSSAALGPPDHHRRMLTGALYRSELGYFGPGQGLGDYAYFIGAYGEWRHALGGELSPQRVQGLLDAYARWLSSNAPGADAAWYVTDEPGVDMMATVNEWLAWQQAGTGPGRQLVSAVTYPLHRYRYDEASGSFSQALGAAELPQLKRFYSGATASANTQAWLGATAALDASSRQWRFYNGSRPGMGTMATEDSGVANSLWPLQYHALGVSGHHFYWYANYFVDYQTNTVAYQRKDVYNRAQTFGTIEPGDGFRLDSLYGWVAFNGTNGDGMLIYPASDAHYPASSFGLDGYFPSLRLRALRQGINNGLWIQRAAARAPELTRAELRAVLGKANGGQAEIAFEVGEAGPGYQHGGATWSEEAADYEALRLRWMARDGF